MFLIVHFVTKDSKIEQLNSKLFLKVQEKSDLQLASSIIEQLCVDITFEVGINFNFCSVCLLTNYRVIRLAHSRILLLDPIFLRSE